MKRIFLALFAALPLFANAQEPTEAQKQEALGVVKNVCGMIERYFGGERLLDTQLYEAMGGRGTAFFNDFTGEEEQAVSFFMYVQKHYKGALQTEISAPDLAKCKIYVEPTLTVNTHWGNVDGSAINEVAIADINAVGASNYYIVFDVVQNYPTLRISTPKKIVYDVLHKKITAVITDNGAYINFLNAVEAFSEKDYQTAISLFEVSIQKERNDESLQKRCYLLAVSAAMYMNDFKKAFKLAELSKDDFLIACSGMMVETENGDWNKIAPYALLLEKVVNSQSDLNVFQKCGAYMSLGTFFVASSQYQDYAKAVSYLEKASALGSAEAKFLIFVFSHNEDIPDGMFADDEGIKRLFEAAELGYPPAFVISGIVEEKIRNNNQQAMKWYEKAAKSGNSVGMVHYGRLLVESGKSAEGKSWLRKSLEGDGLEQQIEYYAMILNMYPFVKSRQEVVDMLDGKTPTDGIGETAVAQPAQPVHPTQPALPVAPVRPVQSAKPPVTSATQTPSVGVSTSSGYSSRWYRRPFNPPVDDYKIAGLSVGYVSKQWQAKAGGESIKYGIWEDSKRMNGLQVGVRVEPQFKFGFGLNTGLFYEFYYTRGETLSDDYGEYHEDVMEHSLYLPVHLEYRLNFSEAFQLFFFGGIGLDCGLAASYRMIDENDHNYDVTVDDVYGSDMFPDWKRFNASLEYGAGIRIYMVQLNFAASKGLVNMSSSDEYSVYQNKDMAFSLSYMF